MVGVRIDPAVYRQYKAELALLGLSVQEDIANHIRSLAESRTDVKLK